MNDHPFIYRPLVNSSYLVKNWGHYVSMFITVTTKQLQKRERVNFIVKPYKQYKISPTNICQIVSYTGKGLPKL